MSKGIAFFLGVLLFEQQNALIPTHIALFLSLGILLAVLFRRRSFAPLIIITLTGFLWNYAYTFATTTSIPTSFFNTKFITTGVVEEVQQSSDKTTIIFNSTQPFEAKLRLAIYNSHPPLQVGERLQLKIKLKTPHTYFDEEGFDYEKYLFARHISGVGYVDTQHPIRTTQHTTHYPLNQLREIIAQKLNALATHSDFIGIIKAITIGDKSAIKAQHQKILLKTNTSHLSVISGLHIGMLAALGALLGHLLFRYCPCIKRLPLPILSSMMALLFAGIYTLLAGFSLPTMRAFIMLSVFLLGMIGRNHYNKWQLLSVALVVILLINPHSVLNIGFYLSFISVAVIVLYLQLLLRSPTFLGKLKHIFLMQLIISAFSLPLSMYFFGFVSFSSVIANLVAIPLFSFIIVPFSLMAALLVVIGYSSGAEILLEVVTTALNYLFDFLSFLAESTLLYAEYSLSSTLLVVLFCLAIMLIITHHHLRFAPLGVVLLLSIFLRTTDNHHLIIFDVGQGSAMALVQGEHALIIDTGNKFHSGFSLAKSVIIPTLQARQITAIDTLIISHNDSDHRGGREDILQQYVVQNLINPQDCNEQVFRFGAETIEILATDNQFKGNNASCVVKISGEHISILFSADIEKPAERYLVEKYGKRLQADVLIVPHHGSKTSSTLEFLHTVQPKLAIISAGFESKYHHPHPQVVQRYQDLGIPLLNTACSGQITIDMHSRDVTELRKEEGKYYHHQCITNILK